MEKVHTMFGKPTMQDILLGLRFQGGVLLGVLGNCTVRTATVIAPFGVVGRYSGEYILRVFDGSEELFGLNTDKWPVNEASLPNFDQRSNFDLIGFLFYSNIFSLSTYYESLVLASLSSWGRKWTLSLKFWLPYCVLALFHYSAISISPLLLLAQNQYFPPVVLIAL